MVDLKPMTLYSHKAGPNPWKVAVILEELGLPYENRFLDMSVVKQEPYISISINGRVPSLEDPNTGVVLWESGAIIQYLIAEYDKDHRISCATSPEKYLTEQWLYFQASGQGPYYGQYIWFNKYHPEKVPSATERYKNEILRVMGVIDSQLERTGKKWLVGDKCTYADLSFIAWGRTLHTGGYGFDPYEGDKYPAYRDWFDRLLARDAVKKVFDEKDEVNSASSKYRLLVSDAVKKAFDEKNELEATPSK